MLWTRGNRGFSSSSAKTTRLRAPGLYQARGYNLLSSIDSLRPRGGEGLILSGQRFLLRVQVLFATSCCSYACSFSLLFRIMNYRCVDCSVVLFLVGSLHQDTYSTNTNLIVGSSTPVLCSVRIRALKYFCPGNLAVLGSL